ncbi:TERF1-interacting nuclear factor 2 isoform X1 [Pimephales promelas]|uniref:TERF1-interacting nuclear factor 2 isoform X1 n=1 Tax=Pimephales promelas TaxID=90988 RepID=UPI001955EED5|nr:TERF1-interacting nuclear factor 2 isoform X1 [Pimephales promelas]KAG1936230.1 TERF1-interacting nuclear factor [Pimephales promelas]
MTGYANVYKGFFFFHQISYLQNIRVVCFQDGHYNNTAINSMEEGLFSTGAPLPLSALQLLAPPLRLMSAAMWKVMLKRDVVYYGKLEEIVTSLCETVPGLLHYRHRAKLTMGLRALMILEELRRSDPPDTQHVLEELCKLEASSIPGGRRKEQKVEEAKNNFKTLVHSLLKNPTARKQFFKEEFHLHYGGDYAASLEKLMWEFIIRVDKLLPVPDLAQTVSWLSGAPAVLEECARSASQPQLLRTLLQHEKCLGHLDSTSLLSSTGDLILTSLSLPLSGKVLQTVQSESTPTSNRVSNLAPSTARATRRTAKEAQLHITPVIGSISNDDLPKNNEKVASRLGQEVESTSEIPINTRSKLRSYSKKQILEKDPEEDHFVGNMLVTVISQSSGSEAEEEEGEEGSKEDMKESNVSANRPKKTEVKNGNEETVDVTRKYSANRNTEPIESQEAALRISCVTRQLRVVLPRLNISNANLSVRLNHHPSDEQEIIRSPSPVTLKDRGGKSVSKLRKRKFIDLSSTPEKHLTLSVKKLTSAHSPCVPLVRLPMGIPETPSPLVKSSDDIIDDSDDDTTGSVKKKVFNQQYFKTKNGTYVPTLREFWNPVFSPSLSPGSRH